MKRSHALLSHESATTAGTRVLDLDISDPISRIVVELKPTNNLAVPTAHPMKCITKVEVVDGSDVIASASGYELDAAGLLDGRNVTFQALTYINDNINAPTVAINFGRWLWDKMLAFDPRKFTNPQLRITHDRSLGGSAPDAADLSVFVDIFDGENISPIGFLSIREAFTYSLTSSAVQRVDLPVDKKIRRIILQSLAADKQPYEQYNKVKLTIDSDKHVLMNDLSTSDLLKYLDGNPMMSEQLHANLANETKTHYITPTYVPRISLTGFGTAITGSQVNGIYGGNVDLTATSTGDTMSIVEGKAPHGALSIPMGDQNEPADWLDLSAAKKFECVITAGSSVGSSSTCQVVTESLRRY